MTVNGAAHVRHRDPCLVRLPNVVPSHLGALPATSRSTVFLGAIPPVTIILGVIAATMLSTAKVLICALWLSLIGGAGLVIVIFVHSALVGGLALTSL
jgi:hypothetical protein